MLFLPEKRSLMEIPQSKSKKKRDAEALQKLGIQLIGLTSLQLDSLPLTLELRQAIEEAKRIKSHGATRRQAQLIGKLMRAADAEEIRTAYEILLNAEKGKTASFHHAEQLRQRLLSDDSDALTDFIRMYQPADIQRLRQLIKQAIADRISGENSGAAKALFRFLRFYLS